MAGIGNLDVGLFRNRTPELQVQAIRNAQISFLERSIEDAPFKSHFGYLQDVSAGLHNKLFRRGQPEAAVVIDEIPTGRLVSAGAMGGDKGQLEQRRCEDPQAGSSHRWHGERRIVSDARSSRPEVGRQKNYSREYSAAKTAHGRQSGASWVTEQGGLQEKQRSTWKINGAKFKSR